ncbi:MAG: VWA domain-containing protein [Myxococcales bacterium]|nr:VWA domain-containing protein [Myxococcales bacterium]
MNRTFTYLATAAGLALLAVVLGLPAARLASRPTPPSPKPEVPKADPLPPPVPMMEPEGSLTMESRLSHPYVPRGRSDLFLSVDLSAVTVPGEKRAPVSLALVLDRSGSMSGFKLQRAKQAARQLVSQLGDEDQLAIVQYGSDVRTLPLTPATAEGRAKMLRTIDRIYDDGGTNIGAGLKAGRAQLQAAAGICEGGACPAHRDITRLILISDGQPTEGVTSERGLTQLARSIREEGITVSALGVGADFNEDLMQRIAEVGSGSYGYIQDASRLASVFQMDLRQAGTTVAREVKLSLELPTGVELGDVLGYRFQRAGNRVEVPLPDFASGQLERLVVRLSVDAQVVGQAVDVVRLELGYSDLLRNGPGRRMAQLSAMVTQRREEVLAHRDREAVIRATRAQSGDNYRKAAELVSRGEPAKAQQLIRQNEALFDSAEEVAGGEAMASERADNQAVFGLVQGSSPAAAPAAVKDIKQRALKSYGRGNSVY